jgi:predicted peptidase
MKKDVRTYAFDGMEQLLCQVWLPEGMDGSLPAILFLHGAGERGYDENLLAFQALPKYLAAGREIPAVVICPQCPEDINWKGVLPPLGFVLEDILQRYPIDRKKLAITGISMGGFGTWEMGMSFPGFFAALAPICGGGVSWRVYTMGKTPVWAFHGDADDVVPAANSIEMCDRLKKCGGNVKLTLFHGVTHNSWEPAYEDTKLIEWLVGASKK